jgi:hypothetical protein
MAYYASKFAYVALWLAVGISVSLSQGCARPDAFHRAQSASGPEQKLPFHQNSDHAADDSAHPAVPPDGKPASGAPFHLASHSRILPAGTLITVQLESSLSILRVHAGDEFTASVAGPITLNGETILERGAPVSGRVESAQPSMPRPGLSPDPGYVRLTLNSVTVDGRALLLQTSSLFAKGSLPSSASSGEAGSSAQSSDLRVSKGRRLTFRLTAPVTFPDQDSIANRRSTDASNQ